MNMPIAQLSIDLPGGYPCKPGNTLTGMLSWPMHTTPALDVRIFWQTKGKGTVDVGEGARCVVPASSATGQVPFSLPVPLEPPTFSRRLISIIWAVEARDNISHAAFAKEIIISPTGSELHL
jgi:hypothetical protein